MSDAKILYLNPGSNIDNDDELFADMARRFKSPGTEVHVASFPAESGAFRHLEYYSYGDLLMPWIIHATRQAEREGFDAMIVGCFYDPGLRAAKEVAQRMAVIGPCEAATGVASSVSNRFGVIVGRRKWVDLMQELVERYGHGRKLSGFYPVGLGVSEFQEDHACTEQLLYEAGRKAIEEDGAESLILGCTLEVGFYETLQDKLGVPVIDAAIASLKQAEHAARLRHDCGWGPSKAGSGEAPSEEEFLEFTGFAAKNVFGNRLIVSAA